MKKTILSILALIILLSLSFWIYQKRASQKAASNTETPQKQAIPVSIRTVAESQSLPFVITYPALISGDQEITLSAKNSGAITSLNFDLGDWVSAGKQLVTIDDPGNLTETGENGLKSYQIQQLEISLEKAEESYKLAKRNYEDVDSYANKKAKEIAKLEKERAEIELQSALDGRFLSSPISGYVIARSVSLGDSVSIGQMIAKISKTGLFKIQFYVDETELPSIKNGLKISVDKDGQKIPATVVNISPQADATTKRFLVEAKPDNTTDLKIGTIKSVSFERNRLAEEKNWLILPLSSITVSQSENYIFIDENGIAKKVPVEIKKINGETSQVQANLPEDAQIIIEGNKLLQDGDAIILKK